MNSAQDILHFWFVELSQKDWWKKSESLDYQIEKRFLKTWQKAKACELSSWRKSAKGRLAEIIVLDQFSRNIFRDKPQSFSQDGLALALAQEAVALGLDKELSITQRSFLYLPYMHSESLAIHEKAVELYSIEGLEYNLEFEHKHKVIIERFGRYPHRNEVLGRRSSKEELEFLKEPNSSF